MLLTTGCLDPLLTKAPPCVEGTQKTCQVGPCSGEGARVCRGGEWSDCEGYQRPEAEVCNGFDDDCNGVVDDAMQDERLGAMCGSEEGSCRTGYYQCRAGALVCVGGVGPVAERCNGADDDCDGQIDEEIPEQVCYTGPEGTRGVGICHAGIELCRDGRMVCDFEQGPVAPDCRNGLDNNCDGFIDHADNEDVDLVLFFDRSASMTPVFSQIRQGLMDFVEVLGDSDRIRVALVGFPDEREDGKCQLVFGFSQLGEAQPQIESFELMELGIEPSYECLRRAADGSFGLEFRPTAKRAFLLFTDEGNSNNPYTQADVAEVMNAVYAQAHFFVDPRVENDYADIATMTNGTMDTITGGDLGQRVLALLVRQSCE